VITLGQTISDNTYKPNENLNRRSVFDSYFNYLEIDKGDISI
jgi:hypothetical protein